MRGPAADPTGYGTGFQIFGNTLTGNTYEEYGEELVDMLDGMFSFVLLDTRDKSFIAARDAIGITPLYMGWGLDGSVWFASEMKALSDDCERFISFPPGHIYSSKQA
ncbi:hypothetical protein RHGRI_007037 [Rhododendron griersonianum]|uniref:Glutamine amidotransferase type-2 domain-containing protein n=1 Tax=Rhododendron griersonianum TaxID=479676 RepID=A0AAV6KVD1_9ERIC|nr:hypothetical protein RHGRI_007037 [Rhododendron griersonianum]